MNSYSDDERPHFRLYLGLILSGEEEDATDVKIRKFIESSRSEETNRKPGLWIRRFARHCEKQNGVGTFEQLSRAELNTLLCITFSITFITEASPST